LELADGAYVAEAASGVTATDIGVPTSTLMEPSVCKVLPYASSVTVPLPLLPVAYVTVTVLLWLPEIERKVGEREQLDTAPLTTHETSKI
jgi:hypothetical protein